MMDLKTTVASFLPKGDKHLQLMSGLLLVLVAILVLFEQTLGIVFARVLTGMWVGAMLLLAVVSGQFVVNKQLIIPIIGLMVVLVVNTIQSQVVEDSLLALIYYLALLAVFLLSYSLSRLQSYSLGWMVKVVWFFGVLVTAYFLSRDFYTGRLVAGWQLIGPFNWHNQMGAFLLYLISFSPYVLSSIKNPKVTVSVTMLLLTATIFTYSRGTWLLLLVILLFFAWGYRELIRKHKKIFVPVSLAVIIGLLIILPMGTVLPRLESLAKEFIPSQQTSSGMLRSNAYRSSITMFSNFPIVGVGLGAFGSAFYAYQEVPWLYARYAHNHYLQLLAEVGVVGVLSFSAFVVVAVLVFFKKINSTSDRSLWPLLGGVICALLVAGLHNVIDVDWNWPSLGVLFVVFAGMLIGRSVQTTVVPRLSFRLLAYLLGIMLVGMSLWLGSFHWFLTSAEDAFKKSDIQTADNQSDMAQKLLPVSYRVYQLKGHIARYSEDYIQGEHYYRMAVFYNPFNAESLFGVGTMLDGQQKPEALQWYELAMLTNPFSHPRYYQAFALELIDRGQNDEAKSVLHDAIYNSFPLNQAYNDFLFLYADSEFTKDLAQTYGIYAILLVREGKYETARDLLTTAVTKLNPKDQSLLQILDSLP